MQLKKKKKKEREALGDKVSFLLCCHDQSKATLYYVAFTIEQGNRINIYFILSMM